MSLRNKIAFYGTMYTAAFSLGFYKTYTDAPDGVDMALVALPMLSGAAALKYGPGQHKTTHHDTALGAAFGAAAEAGIGCLELAVHGAAGTIGTGIAEICGMGAGYVVKRF